MCPSWLLLFAILVLMCLIGLRGDRVVEGFRNTEMVDRTYQWLYYNLWFPRYEWDEKGKRIMGTSSMIVDGPRLVGQAYVRLKDAAPASLSGNATDTPVEGIIDQCKKEGINCHNIVSDTRTNKNYVNSFGVSDQLVWAPGFVTYVRQYPDTNPMTGHMYAKDVRVN
jgi:hypothetical protein